MNSEVCSNILVNMWLFPFHLERSITAEYKLTNLDKSLKLSSSIKKSASRCKTFRYLARRKKVKKDFLPFREIT